MSGLTGRIFAVIPAAGLSRRMGLPKLLLPWQDSTVIECLLRTLQRPEIVATVVVMRPDDVDLRNAVARTSAIAVIPGHAPPDMRDSVELGLQTLRERFQPRDEEAWFLIPADHPVLETETVSELLSSWNKQPCQILVPKYGERRGHPALLRWSLAAHIAALPADVGINALWKSSPELLTEWPTSRESVLADLDTPEDYAAWQRKLQDRPTLPLRRSS